VERPSTSSKSRRTGLPLPKPYLLKMMTDDDVKDVGTCHKKDIYCWQLDCTQ
jgi:hypothetical protein